MLLLASVVGSCEAHAAYTEPRLALVRGTVVQAASGARSLQLQGSFSFADAVQLGLPLQVVIIQGTFTARLDLNGNVFTSTGGGPEKQLAAPGIVSVAAREILLALPPGFSPGVATVQVVAAYEGRQISSNRLEVTL